MRLDSRMNGHEPALRLLLRGEGTVTDMLQAISGECIMARKLTQRVRAAVHRIAPLDLARGELLMHRRVVLQGDRTGINYIYADSLIAFERLSMRFRQELLNSDRPIGRLWRDHRVGISKEVMSVSRHPAGDLARHFGSGPETNLVVRTCRIFAAGRPIMMITEHFSPQLGDATAVQDSGLSRIARKWKLRTDLPGCRLKPWAPRR